MAELGGRTALILGLGAIGTEVARLAKAVGMRTIAINRRGLSDSKHVDEVYGSHRLHDLLGRADAVVVTLPLTVETRGILDAAAIGRMKPRAILVNVGRGDVIDEQALVGALRGQRLGGAAPDVFGTEPLPTESPLWELTNVLVSPHTAALSLRENERIVEAFIENLRRYHTGHKSSRPSTNRACTRQSAPLRHGRDQQGRALAANMVRRCVSGTYRVTISCYDYCAITQEDCYEIIAFEFHGRRTPPRGPPASWNC